MDSKIAAIRGAAARMLKSRRAISVFAGNGIGQVVALAAVPLIARVYDAASVGSFGLFASVVACFAVVSCLALDQAVMLADDEAELRALQAASALVLIAFVLLLTVALLIAQPFGLERLRLLGANASLVPPAVLLAGLVQIGIQSATRRGDFGSLTRGFAARTGGTAVAQLGMAFVLCDGTGMILGQMAAVTVTLALLAGGMLGAVPSWGEVRAAMVRHRNCPLFLAPRLAVGALGDVAVLVLVSSWFRPQEIGYYWMAGRLLQVPAGFMDPPTRQLFISAARDSLARTGRFGTVFMTATLGLLGVAGAFTLMLLLFGHTIIRTVLGAGWEPAAPYVQVIAFGWCFEFAGIPFSNAVLLLGLQRQHFIYDTIQRILMLGALGIGCVKDDLLLGCILAAIVKGVLVTGFGTFLAIRSMTPARVELAGVAG